MTTARLVARCSLAATLPFAALGAQWTAPSALTEGTRIRVSVVDSAAGRLQRFQIDGLLRSIGGDTLYVAVGDGGLSRIPTTRIQSVSIPTARQHPFVRDIIVGSALGLAAGLVGERTFPADERCRALPLSGQVECGVSRTPYLNAATGVVGGAALGLTTAAIGRSQWIHFGSSRSATPKGMAALRAELPVKVHLVDSLPEQPLKAKFVGWRNDSLVLDARHQPVVLHRNQVTSITGRLPNRHPYPEFVTVGGWVGLMAGLRTNIDPCSASGVCSRRTSREPLTGFLIGSAIGALAAAIGLPNWRPVLLK